MSNINYTLETEKGEQLAAAVPLDGLIETVQRFLDSHSRIVVTCFAHLTGYPLVYDIYRLRASRASNGVVVWEGL